MAKTAAFQAALPIAAAARASPVSSASSRPRPRIAAVAAHHRPAHAVLPILQPPASSPSRSLAPPGANAPEPAAPTAAPPRPDQSPSKTATTRTPSRDADVVHDIVLCHATADFDSLAAAVGLAKLRGPSTRVILPAGMHPSLRRYLSLHKSLFPIMDLKLVDPKCVEHIAVVDTQLVTRLGPAAAWLRHAQSVEVIDHHMGAHDSDARIAPQHVAGSLALCIEPVGAASTIVVERLLAAGVALSPPEATLLALGIHTDTLSLRASATTSRDAAALAALLGAGACMRTVGLFARDALDEAQQALLRRALDALDVRSVRGARIACVHLSSDGFVKGAAAVAQAVLQLADADAVLLAVDTPAGRGGNGSGGARRVSLIGRASGRVDAVDFSRLLGGVGGGGHPAAAAASVRVADGDDVDELVARLVSGLCEQIPPAVTAADMMSSPAVAVTPQCSMREARDLLFETGHTGLAVVRDLVARDLVGVVSRQDVALAERRGKLDTPVKGWVARKVISIEPVTPLHVIEAMMVDNDVGRLPVVVDGCVVGIVTRSDVLAQRRMTSCAKTS